MPRLALIFLIACSGASTPPRNLVCERVAIIQAEAKVTADKFAKCEREYSGEGALYTHTARITPPGGTTVICGLNAGQLSMACGTLEAAQGSASK